MRVLYLINHAGKGGTERYVEALATCGEIKPYFAYNESGLLSERMEAAGVPTWQLPINSRFDIGAAKHIANLCCENRIDVIHTHYLRENYTALLSRLFYSKPRVVYTYHILTENGFVTRLSNRLISLLQHRVITVCTPGKARLIANGVPERLITLVHNGIDAERWACDKRENDVPVFVYATRVVAGKGHETLLQAAALVERPFRLVIAGDGELLDTTRELAADLGLDVYFTGFSEDVRSVLATADICVSPSEAETLSMNILEAMAAGLPVIATDAGGNFELLNTGCGILVPVGDVRALANAMIAMLDSPELRERYSEAGLSAVRADFSIRRMIRDTLRAYE